MRKSAILVVLASAGIAMADGPVASGGAGGSAGGPEAVYLWDQSGAFTNGIINQTFSDFPTASTYLVDDFSTGGNSWSLTAMNGLFFGGSGNWAGLTSARISFYAKSGAMPGSGDVAGTESAPVTVVPMNNGYLVIADLSGIAACQNINGDYWIGMTPDTSLANNGQQFHALLDSDQYGDDAALRNPGEYFGVGGDWVSASTLSSSVASGDSWFQLSGNVVPTPGAAAALGLGGLMIGRRRR